MCILNVVMVGFIFKIIKCIDCFFFRKWRGLKICKLLFLVFVSIFFIFMRVIWGKEFLLRFFWKGMNFIFFFFCVLG